MACFSIRAHTRVQKYVGRESKTRAAAPHAKRLRTLMPSRVPSSSLTLVTEGVLPLLLLLSDGPVPPPPRRPSPPQGSTPDPPTHTSPSPPPMPYSGARLRSAGTSVGSMHAVNPSSSW
ncbi:hypothetical protein EYF80_064761 [Liparis tanakae]|uniref:Uncharacterized protein n=1 Tax=Liparis tanakae TaxID=230148 RepID=A0A4Z2E8V2_9TELE|nr:hypothetical protein EYF80_064761 [Liparis tanakae]